jgi:aminoglycoside/choline kinase family phosphotransferase
MTTTVEPLLALLNRTFPRAKVDSVTPMPGGMSSRRFFRVRLTAQGQTEGFPDSVVGVFTPNAQSSDEATHEGDSERREWPFIEVHRLLSRVGVRVPQLYGTAREDGWMAQEDLGDLTLAQALLQHPEQRTGLYQRAVRDLAHAHAVTSALPDDSIVKTRRFDRTLLLWEIEHFREFALLARNIVPTPAQNRRYTDLANALAEHVASLPTGFVHRDYQSRNLMWLPETAAHVSRSGSSTVPAGELVWLDFQDALTGPRVYDLVALLNDSYQVFTRDFVEARLGEYAALRGGPNLTAGDVVTEFDAVTVQRKLKDAGRFVYFHVKNGDASYLQFVDPTVEKIKSSLERLSHLPLFREWGQLLDELIPTAAPTAQ